MKTINEIDEILGIWTSLVEGHVAETYNDVGGYRIDSSYGKMRIQEVIDKRGAVRDVSPRLEKKQMLRWLKAGIVTATERVINELKENKDGE